MITGILGNRGSGKTLTAVIYAYHKYLDGYTIYSNIKLNFPYIPYDIDMLLDFAESGKYFGETLFLIDEVHILFDSRTSGKSRNRIFSYFLNQSSKNALDIIYTTQFSRQAEIRLRLNTEVVITCNARSIVYKSANSNPIILPNYRPKKTDFKCITYIRTRTIKFSDTGYDTEIMRTYLGNPYFKLYDTREVVKIERDKFERETLKKKETKKERQDKRDFNNAMFKKFNEGLL
jgi:hypothetical protein